MRIHLICRGNAFRSRIAEAYLQSLHIPHLDVISSGTVAAAGKDENGDMPLHTHAILQKHGLLQFAKPSWDQASVGRMKPDDFVIFFGARAQEEARTLGITPVHSQTWDVPDAGELVRGKRNPGPHDPQIFVFTEQTYGVIVSYVDALLAELHLRNSADSSTMRGIKRRNYMQKIVPHLWFDTQAKEAAEFYVSIFPDATITSSIVLHDTPSGDCDQVAFTLGGQDFMAISAGPLFSFNPTISFILNFDPSRDDKAKEHLKELWEALSDGGTPLMPLQEYPFSKLYGWVQDKYGVTWQLMLTDPQGEPRPFLIPALMFAGENTNKAGEAVEFYLSVFKDAKKGVFAPYAEATGPAKKGSLMFGDFMLENQWLAAMDSGVEQPFVFNEAISLMVRCETQDEIDYYWEKLSAVPESEQCGWLKDKYGVSWQITPTTIVKLMEEGTPEQIARVTQAFLKMKKFDIATLEAAYEEGAFKVTT